MCEPWVLLPGLDWLVIMQEDNEKKKKKKPSFGL